MLAEEKEEAGLGIRFSRGGLMWCKYEKHTSRLLLLLLLFHLFFLSSQLYSLNYFPFLYNSNRVAITPIIRLVKLMSQQLQSALDHDV